MDLDHERRLTEVEARATSNTKRINKLEESTEAINRMAISVEKMAMKQDAMNGNITELRSDVETLKSKPAKRWEYVVEKAVYIIVAAVIGYALAQIGL